MPRTKRSPTNARVTSTDDFLKLIPYLDDDVVAQLILRSPDHDGALQQYRQEAKEADYPTDPIKFTTDILGYQMWGKLEQICRSVEKQHNTVVASGFGLGKSILASALVCWFMTRYDDAKVIIVAPTWGQVQNILFRYIRTVGRRANLPGQILDSPRWEVSSEHFAIGLSPRRSSAEDISSIQGYHGAHLMVVMDEAAGLPRIIYDAVAGLAVGDDCRILAIGNPIEQSGPFWEACNNPSWSHVNISCLDHPNVLKGREIIPGAVTRRWVEERAEEWATEVEQDTPGAVEIPWTHLWYLPQPIFYAKVLGIAPEQAEDQLIKLSWVVEAQNRILEQKNPITVAGLDPARRGGDSSVLLIRSGNKIVSIQRWQGQDLASLADRVGIALREWDVQFCYVDEIGIGAGLLDFGRRNGMPLIGVNVARTAIQRTRFANLRAECWWRVRELLREGRLEIPNDNLLQGDLITPRYYPDNYQRIALESKDEIRARIKRSPDTGDALALSYAQPTVLDSEEIVKSLRQLAAASNPANVSRWGAVKTDATRLLGSARNWRAGRR
jgi:hypothetical protein